MNQDAPASIPLKEAETEDAQLEKLRQHFHQRLKKEKARLSALARAQGSAQVPAVSTLVDIREFAHRLRGAALVFGFQALGDCAKSLELAAIAASLEENLRACDPAVTATMRALESHLTDEIASYHRADPAMQPSGFATKP